MNIRKPSLRGMLLKANPLDKTDPLSGWRGEFMFPYNSVCDARGNSLGACPGAWLSHHMSSHIDIWRHQGHDGHFSEEFDGVPWWRYHELFEEHIANLLGTDASVPEAVVGNSLSINNYMLILEFLALARATTGKKKILTLSTFFNSDIESIKKAIYIMYGSEKVDEYCILVKPDKGDLYSMSHIKKAIADAGDDLAMVFVPIVCHKTGQRFHVDQLAEVAHSYEAFIGVDLAHGIGNVPLQLSKWNIDFATFCSYKYLNGGPGGVGGFYVNKKHIDSLSRPSGWWGISSETRFGPSENYLPAKGARRFLSSNDPILNMQALKTYLFKVRDLKGGWNAIFKKHEEISLYAHQTLSLIPGIEVITPLDFNDRGCQISFRVLGADVKTVLQFLKSKQCYVEDRGDILRSAFVAYNRYKEVAELAKALSKFKAK